MPDMIHYSAIFELPDGEHHMHGWSENLQTARRHVDGHILNRRRAMIPDEKARLLSIRVIAPSEVDAVVKAEDDRIRAKYPDREHVTEAWDSPNRILDNRVTPEPDQP